MAHLLGVSTVILGLVAAAPQPIQPLLRTTTTKTTSAFAGCFRASQEKASQPWAFMPSDHGGTFTNSGANGPEGTYWLNLQRSLHGAEIRLYADVGARPAKAISEGVDQCR